MFEKDIDINERFPYRVSVSNRNQFFEAQDWIKENLPGCSFTWRFPIYYFTLEKDFVAFSLKWA